MRRIKCFLLILVALWLPLQAAAAVVMPFCRHAAEQAQQVEVLQVPAHCHEHIEAVADPADMGTVVGCDNCEMCHLATTGYLPAAATPLMPETATVLVALPSLALPSHIGAPPQQPPRRLN